MAVQKKSSNFALANEKWRFRLAARTHASHAWNTGSIPVGATKVKGKRSSVKRLLFFIVQLTVVVFKIDKKMILHFIKKSYGKQHYPTN